MVKNITIKDEAYAYLKSQKGERSFSDVILAKKFHVSETVATYGKTFIEISTGTKEFLDSLKVKGETYDDVIAHFEEKKPSKSYLALKALYGTAKENDWDYEAIAQNKKDFGRSSHK